jgi:hypothetical protein
LIHRHTNPLPVSKKTIVRALQDDTPHLVGVAEVADIGLTAEVLDFLVDDCGRDVWVPALRRGESFEVAGVRVEDVGALRGPGVRGVGFFEDDGGPEDGVGGSLDVPGCRRGPDLV